MVWDGCQAEADVRHYHWQANGATPPVWDWYTGGGQISYNAAVETEDHGECVVQGGVCKPDPAEPCLAEIQLETTGGGSLTRFVSDASGCVKWGDLTAAEKKLIAKSTTCDDAERQDIFIGYNNTTCTTGMSAGPEKVGLSTPSVPCAGTDRAKGPAWSKVHAEPFPPVLALSSPRGYRLPNRCDAIGATTAPTARPCPGGSTRSSAG